VSIVPTPRLYRLGMGSDATIGPRHRGPSFRQSYSCARGDWRCRSRRWVSARISRALDTSAMQLAVFGMSTALRIAVVPEALFVITAVYQVAPNLQLSNPQRHPCCQSHRYVARDLDGI
jgi:hypothetical protein